MRSPSGPKTSAALLREQALRKVDPGTVTAEFAIVLPAVIALTLLVLSLSQVIVTKVSCQDAAREGVQAYQMALVSQTGPASASTGGGGQGRAEAVVHQRAGNEARVVFTSQGDTTRIDVTCPVRLGTVPFFHLSLHSEAYALKVGENHD